MTDIQLPDTKLPKPAGFPPESLHELISRAQSINGFTLGELADIAHWTIPENLRSAKGWPGQLIEYFLGASAGSRPEQDFPELGVELKTIPVTPDGKPVETTYVCIAPLTGLNNVSWEQSNVRNKLSMVLWVPVDGRREIAVSERIVGQPVLWQPTPEEESVLRSDWEEITEQIILGNINQVTARYGTALQLRPKAANNKALTSAIGPEGEPIQTLPRGYYLKQAFTQQILLNHIGAVYE